MPINLIEESLGLRSKDNTSCKIADRWGCAKVEIQAGFEKGSEDVRDRRAQEHALDVPSFGTPDATWIRWTEQDGEEDRASGEGHRAPQKQVDTPPCTDPCQNTRTLQDYTTGGDHYSPATTTTAAAGKYILGFCSSIS